MSRFPNRLGLASTFLAVLVMATASYAQDDRGGGRGERGGGERGGGERGGGQDGGGFRGGPPGGGFPDGGPPGGGFPSGGFRGGPPGGPGGFSPADMLRRFDENGNGMIDPAESQGRAGFFLQRIASEVPGIDLAKPVPIEKLSQAMDRMRQQRESSGGDNNNSGPGSSSTASKTIEPLVPGFGVEDLLPPVPGFGSTAELFSIKITDADNREAKERFGRYDSNHDGILDKDELARGRWSEDPLTYDRNHDGKLTLSEMAVRYAQRRVSEEASRATQTASRSGDSRDSRGGTSGRGNFGGGGEDPRSFFSRREGGGDSSGGGEASSSPKVAAVDARKSYRVKSVTERLPKGLPDWFARSDANADGQVAMAEFATSWSESVLSEFGQFDLNHDGMITPEEALSAVNKGVVRGSAASPSSSSSAATVSPTTISTAASTGTSPATSQPAAASGETPQIDPRYVVYYQKLLSKYDTNGDGALVVSEWQTMSKDPSAADTDGDGRISVNELAVWSTKR